VRDALKKLAGYVKELEKKGAAALPGLIGSVGSFILRKAGEVVGYVAEHLSDPVGGMCHIFVWIHYEKIQR
jgi:hypothetical protein